MYVLWLRGPLCHWHAVRIDVIMAATVILDKIAMALFSSHNVQKTCFCKVVKIPFVDPWEGMRGMTG